MICDICGTEILYGGDRVILFGVEILICKKCKAISEHHIFILCPTCKVWEWQNHDYDCDTFAYAGMLCNQCRLPQLMEINNG
jgi:hypothetical protein